MTQNTLCYRESRRSIRPCNLEGFIVQKMTLYSIVFILSQKTSF